MNLIRLSILHSVSTFAAVVLVVLFGVLGLYRLPIQLTPDVEAPTISVRTVWGGASPYEIEKEIVEKQEEVLKSVQGLVKLESSSYNSLSTVSLTFAVGTDLNDAMVRVSNKLNEVSSYPENANQPVIDASGEQQSPVIWLTLKRLEGDSKEVQNYGTFFEEEIRQHLERVPGVGSLFVFGGREKQLQVVIDPVRLAQHNITVGEVISRLQSANQNISAGVLGLDKRNYRLRTVSQFQSPDDVLEVLLKDDGLRRVRLGDVARAEFGYTPNPPPVMHNNKYMIVTGIRKEAGANVLELVDRMREVVDDLNAGLLRENGLYYDWVYDQGPYIRTAIDNVQQNLMIGGLLAICVLLVFLRSVSSTLTVALAIPISVASTFIFLYAFNRTLNVVSLAGISFAVGMLVDNAIVVLENIDRHRRMGKDAFRASYDGAKEVWGAVLASTATTVAVFLPVLFVEEEAGQLFRDIAIAIAFSIIVSLLVSISVIPTITNKFYRLSRRKIVVQTPALDQGNWMVRIIMGLSRLTLRNWMTRLSTVTFFVVVSLVAAYFLVPKAEYLPQGNRNLILNILVPPPGYSEAKREEIGGYIFKSLAIHQEKDYLEGVPQIDNIFYVSADRITIFGATSKHVDEARGMMTKFNQVMNSIPGMFGVSIQQGIFASGLGKGRTVDVNVTGDDLEQIVGAARTVFGALKQAIPEAQIRPVPSLEISYPEANLIPNRSRLMANGFTEAELGVYVDVLMDGRKVGEFKPDGARVIDLVLRSDDRFESAPEEILNGIVVNKFGQLMRVGDVADIEYGAGMTQIDHLERGRNITLQVTPPESVALQSAMELITNELVPNLKNSGKLDHVDITVGGNADKLDVTRRALQWNFLLAIVITYLLMSALFSNYIYPIIILFSVPMAAAGGFIGLFLVNTFIAPQPFDILVMLGFIILVGTVVNNAILIVHQSLNNVRFEGMQGMEAILWSVRTRIRPIFMSTTTSLFGMLPLVLSTGSGSELYRGLGGVILGGLAVSTVLTLFVIPALLAFLIGFEKSRVESAEPAGAGQIVAL